MFTDAVEATLAAISVDDDVVLLAAKFVVDISTYESGLCLFKSELEMRVDVMNVTRMILAVDGESNTQG